MRVLIAGAAGFLGSHLTDRFLADGHEVIGVDNFATGDPRNLAHLEREPRFDFLEADVTAALPLFDVDGVLNLASPASPPAYLAMPLETLRVGSQGTDRLLELAHAAGARFFLASTSEVYGDPDVHPQTEDYNGNVSPNGPRSVYDEAKRYAEALTFAWARARGVEVRVARIFNTYGPRMQPDDGRVVSNFLVQAIRGEPLTIYGDGSQTRSFCYVEDEVEGLYRLFLSDEPGPMNIGNPDEHSIRELAEAVAALTGTALTVEHHPLPTDDPKVRCPDITRATERLGWTPSTDLGRGLTDTLDYFTQRVGPTGSGRTS